ncbi:NmrA family NAD(P)-binding protein [Sphingomonas sp. M1-B02]|uniref:NmrA family NAD(P)-binding protein n=1 Tax=Sphingomonas sp. M1-B02 TaxID=3114300 RepID=UPI00223EE9A3|nr:NmrA family NAD(P)-binding protein [Sphingomonas sp. S6-11]UZK66755.1 NmrA family NAD(P)-binding protein [Sphingomonas sp. S6-11]
MPHADTATPAAIALVGGTGDLGLRIARVLVARGARVRALVRSSSNSAALAGSGAEIVPIDFNDAHALREALRGAACLVSALNGLEDSIFDLQGRVLDFAVAAGVPRFIPSDYSLDFTRTRPGRNRNLDLRRRFLARIDAAPIRATSILNGAFAELLAGQAPIVLRGPKIVLHWGSADQLLDFTMKDDVAAYTAAAAMDPNTPRFLRIAGDVVSPRDLAATMRGLTGQRYRLVRPGGVAVLSAMIGIARRIAPEPGAVFPAWQGMQYLRDMMEGRGKLEPLDNERYSGLGWTKARDILAAGGMDLATRA